jgi:hypothetical protein
LSEKPTKTNSALPLDSKEKMIKLFPVEEIK